MNKVLLRSASLILAFVLVIGIFTPGRATSQNAVVMPNKTVNLAYFYKPPANSDAATVANNFSNVILTGGDENFRDQLLTNGFASTISQYFRADGIQDPGNCTSSPNNNQVAYNAGDFCDISQNHSDWFLLDTTGNRMKTSPTSSYYRMDPGNDSWRSYFLTRVLDIQQQKGWSGLFLDNLEASLSEIQNDGLTAAKYPDNASYQAAVRGFIQYLYTNYSQAYNRPMIANIIARSTDAQWFDYLQYLSGAMQERWAVAWSTTSYVSATKWESDMQLAEKTQSQGKYIVLIAPGTQADTNRQTFAFASYLLISNGKASFRYTNSSYYNQVWLYDNYNVQLGSPLGNRYQSGTAWRRDFTNGYVVVNPVNLTAAIVSNPTATSTATPPPTLTSTIVPTQAPTLTATNTATRVPTITATFTATQAPTITSTPSPTLTSTTVPTQAPTFTATNTATRVPTFTATFTATQAPTITSTPSPTLTSTTVPTKVPTFTATSTVTRIPTFTATFTATQAPTITSTPPLAVTIYDDKNSAFVYSSKWSDYSDSLAYQGSYKLTKNNGSSVTLNFTGQSFTVIYKSDPLFGKMDVYVDGNKVGTLNEYAANATYQAKWKYGGTLPIGTHKLQLVFVGSANSRGNLDAVSVP
jgi:hypothetical protein